MPFQFEFEIGSSVSGFFFSFWEREGKAKKEKKKKTPLLIYKPALLVLEQFLGLGRRRNTAPNIHARRVSVETIPWVFETMSSNTSNVHEAQTSERARPRQASLLLPKRTSRFNETSQDSA